MKNKILLFSSLLVSCVLLVVACVKTEDDDSQVKPTSVPYIAVSYLGTYIYAQGNTTIYSDIPDVVAIAVDSVYGFEGGYGGKTGMDSIRILKSDILGFGDTTSIGASNFSFQKYSKGNFRTTLGADIIIAGANNNPGPTPLEGAYLREANGYILELTRVVNGVYLLDSPGGAATVPPVPYLLYNYASSTGMDSLSFPNQVNHCGTGLQLVSPSAPEGLTSAVYTADYPPAIVSTAPLTLSWKVLIFPSTLASATNGGSCNWGPGVRDFVKQ